VDRLEWIHSKNIIHRDIKPENFLIGLKDPNIIYIIDFGSCKKYRSSKTGKHVTPKNTNKFSGTILFSSANVLRGKEPSRRDDLISLGYLLIFLIKKKLPWDFDSKQKDIRNYLKSLKIKETNDNGKLFSYLPEELIEYINYTRNLEFEEKPDYSYLRSLFKMIINKQNMNYRMLTFSWIYFDNRILFGIPNNHSLRNSSAHNRILKKIKEKNRPKKEISQNNFSNKPNGNSAYSIEQISYNFLPDKSTYNNYHSKKISKSNLISKEYETNNKVNKEINHNNPNIQYLRSVNNDKSENINIKKKKLNNNEDNKFNPFMLYFHH
jgi:serine/threonine protein kinase